MCVLYGWWEYDPRLVVETANFGYWSVEGGNCNYFDITSAGGVFNYKPGLLRLHNYVIPLIKLIVDIWQKRLCRFFFSKRKRTWPGTAKIHSKVTTWQLIFVLEHSSWVVFLWFCIASVSLAGGHSRSQTSGISSSIIKLSFASV